MTSADDEPRPDPRPASPALRLFEAIAAAGPSDAAPAVVDLGRRFADAASLGEIAGIENGHPDDQGPAGA